MNDLILPSTLREMRSHLAQPRVATVMAGVALVLGLSGPFETWNTQALPERMLYWALVVWLTYGAGFVVTARLAPALQTLHVGLRSLITASAVAIAVYVVLFGLNLLFGQGPETLGTALASFAAVFVICLVIEVSAQVFVAQAPAQRATDIPASGPPAILQRLPVDKRGMLLSLSVQDHYVNVLTTQGREMVLMRLGDAMRETQPVPGLQVHRSHWVARHAVRHLERRGDGAMLTLTDGTAVPVSRAFMPAIRQAGLLPQRGA